MSAEESQVGNDIESAAKAEGWAPKEDWRGDPEAWVDAPTFVQRGKEILPIVQKKLDDQMEVANSLRSELDDVKQTAAQFREFQKQRVEETKRYYQQQITDLKELKKQAIADADGDQVVKIDDQIDEAKAAQQNVQPPSNDGQKILDDWVKKNEWYGKDEVLRSFADGYATNELAGKFEGAALLNELEKKVKTTFPEKFENKKRETSAVDSGGGKPTKRGKSYNDLPSEAKDACENFIEMVPGYTKEMYVEEYFGDLDE